MSGQQIDKPNRLEYALGPDATDKRNEALVRILIEVFDGDEGGWPKPALTRLVLDYAVTEYAKPAPNTCVCDNPYMGCLHFSGGVVTNAQTKRAPPCFLTQFNARLKRVPVGAPKDAAEVKLQFIAPAGTDHLFWALRVQVTSANGRTNDFHAGFDHCTFVLDPAIVRFTASATAQYDSVNDKWHRVSFAPTECKPLATDFEATAKLE